MDATLKSRRERLQRARREGRRRQHVEDAHELTPERRLAQAAELVAFAEAVEREHGRCDWMSDEPPELWLALRRRHRSMDASAVRRAESCG